MSWDSEWRKSRVRVARARGEAITTALPTDDELREFALWVLLNIAGDSSKAEASRVGAAKALLEAAQRVSQGAGWVPPGYPPTTRPEATQEPDDGTWGGGDQEH